MKLLIVLLLTASFFSACSDRKNDSFTENVKETASDMGDSVNKMGRNIEEEACEMVNGKLECADEKLENTGKNIKDDVKDLSE